MLTVLRVLSASRLAAAAVALALTGAPRVAALHAPEAEHRCGCRAEGAVHECACARCHRASAAAAERSTPPCHRAAPKPARGEGKGPAPCWTGSCGSADLPAAPPSALEAFTLPRPGGLAPPAPSGRVPALEPRATAIPRAPDPPPPRGA